VHTVISESECEIECECESEIRVKVGLFSSRVPRTLYSLLCRIYIKCNVDHTINIFHPRNARYSKSTISNGVFSQHSVAQCSIIFIKE
jgi:hypothetical protein